MSSCDNPFSVKVAVSLEHRYFFDEKVTAPTIVEAVDHSIAATNSNITIGDYQSLKKEISMLEKLIDEKDERIKELKERIEELKSK